MLLNNLILSLLLISHLLSSDFKTQVINCNVLIEKTEIGNSIFLKNSLAIFCRIYLLAGSGKKKLFPCLIARLYCKSIRKVSP